MSEFYGLGAVGDTGNFRAMVSAASPGMTTPEQFRKVNSIDPLLTELPSGESKANVAGVKFVAELPAVGDAESPPTAMVIYIAADGKAAYLESNEAVKYTEL